MFRVLGWLTGLAAIAELTGCAAPRAPLDLRAPGERAEKDAPRAEPSWIGAGDPTLGRLIGDGLLTDPALACDAAQLKWAQSHTHDMPERLMRWLGRPSPDDTEAADLRLIDARRQKAAAIGLTYVDVRRLQAVLILRQQLQTQFRDNADIARWRRDAGLVSGIDGGLAGAMVGVSAGDLDATRAKLAAAKVKLSRETGMDGAQIDALLGPGGAVPILTGNLAAVPPRGADLAALERKLTQALARQHIRQPQLDAIRAESTPDPASRAGAATIAWRKAIADAQAAIAEDRLLLAEASQRDAMLDATEGAAQRNAQDARAAYRLGTGDFARLYAAEAAVLATREARITARADRAAAMIRLWTDEGVGSDGSEAPRTLGTPKQGPACG